MKNKKGIKEKIIPLILILLGILLVYQNLKSFNFSIKLYEIYRNQNRPGLLIQFPQVLPFFDF